MLGDDMQAIEDLRSASRLSEGEFDKALEKLEIHGGARVDFSGNVTAGGTGWKKTYGVQAQYRTEQFDKVLRFTGSSECRMAALVWHFGDVDDANRQCGICDVCNPTGALLKLFRRANGEERRMARAIVDDLRPASYKASGTLQRSLDPLGRMGRADFGRLLDAMSRAGLINIEDAEYEKDGEVRRFRKVRLTDAGLESGALEAAELLMADGIVDGAGGESASQAQGATSKTANRGRKAKGDDEVQCKPGSEALAARLKQWRTDEAKRLAVPAYVVLHDRTLSAVANAKPATAKELLAIGGIGSAKVEKFGGAILELCAHSMSSE